LYEVLGSQTGHWLAARTRKSLVRFRTRLDRDKPLACLWKSLSCLLVKHTAPYCPRSSAILMVVHDPTRFSMSMHSLRYIKRLAAEQ
jgi:hypothetical protein